jgi:hypothetical protein
MVELEKLEIMVQSPNQEEELLIMNMKPQEEQKDKQDYMM